MKVIVITLPEMVEGEAPLIEAFLRRGIAHSVHLRKPTATVEQLEALVRAVPADLHPRLVLHDHFALAVEFGLQGVHLNRRNPLPPAGWQGSVSRSCHSLAEVAEWKARCTYVSLSPIFDSISKQGYRAAFTPRELEQARREGIIDHRVLALGGVTFGRLPDVAAMGFGGAMVLGDAWNAQNLRNFCILDR